MNRRSTRYALNSKFYFKGFSLMELLLYVGIFAVISVVLSGIFLVVIRVQQRESSSAEVTEQLNFVMQTFQRLVRESSNIEIDAGVPVSILKLRMKDSAKDPTCVSLADGAVKLAEGSGSNPNDCAAAALNLTNSRVVVDKLEFKKFSQYPGHDTVSIDIQMTYNAENSQSRIQRTLRSAIARVSAATFDSNLLPGSGSLNLGLNGSAWQNLYLSGLLNLGRIVSDPIGQNGALYYNTTDNVFRGYANGAWSNLGGGYWTAGGVNIYNANSGNVGIGTAAPSKKLQVRATGDVAKFESSEPSAEMLRFSNTAAGGQDWIIEIGTNVNSPAGDFRIRLGGASGDLVIDDVTRNVGIGTTNPNAKLQIAGGDIYASAAGQGLIVKSPDGLICRRIGIDNSGALLLAPVACP